MLRCTVTVGSVGAQQRVSRTRYERGRLPASPVIRTVAPVLCRNRLGDLGDGDVVALVADVIALPCTASAGATSAPRTVGDVAGMCERTPRRAVGLHEHLTVSSA